MTITDRNVPADGSGEKRQLSPKARQAIAAGALLACLLVGAGIVYWLLFGSSPKHRVIQVDPAQQGPAAPRQPAVRAQRRDVPGITRQGDEWVIRSATGEMRLNDKSAGAGGPSYRFPDRLKLSPEQVALIAGQFRILHDDAMAAEWKVTPQQRDRLRALELGGSGMNPTPQQRDELWRLWSDFNKASGGQAKIEAQKKLIDRLEDVAKSHYEPARQQYAARLEEIKKILTAEQVATITRR